MRRIPRENIFSAAAALLAAIALSWTAILMAREPAYRHALARQAALETRLEALERDAAALDALQRPFADADGDGDVNRRMQDLFGKDPAARFHLETTTLAEQFQLHTATVDFAEVGYATLTARIRAAEALRPPLKLTACVLEAAPGKTGEGRARLTFEQIEWRQDTDRQ